MLSPAAHAIAAGCGLCCLLVMVLMLLPAPSVAADQATSAAELSRVRDRIRDLERELQADQARRGPLEQELRATEEAAAILRRELGTIRQRQTALRAEQAALLREQAAQQEVLARQRAALAAQVRAGYLQGPEQPLRVLLNQQDPTLLSRHLTWSAYLARSRQALLAQVNETLAGLAERAAVIDRQGEELAGLEAAQTRELGALDRSRTERGAVLARLKEENRSREQQLRRERQQAADLERLIRELERALARERRPVAPEPRGRPPAQPGGRNLTAGPWPVTGRLLADFGQPRAGGQMKWDGMLIAAPAGSPVQAARSGTVVYADWLPGLGLLLVLDHGGGYLSLYGHNQELTRQVGERVAGGEQIARVGDTGGQSQPALYFEVRRNGRPTNPRTWLR